MLLAVDIGNTHTRFGLYRGSQLVAIRRLPTVSSGNVDESRGALSAFLSTSGTSPQALRAVGISSVVPQATQHFEALLQTELSCTPVVITGKLDLGIKIYYDNPASIGADRICNAVAGFDRHGGPLIVVDLGTATTFDVVNERGDFLGGVIALGLGSQAAELHRRADQLPEIELAVPPSTIGRSTVAGMQAGVMIGGIEAMEGIVRRIRNELGSPARVVATGGLSQLVAAHSSLIHACEPHLVLDGVRLIVERVRFREELQT
jgi:type III pantothenate kinase